MEGGDEEGGDGGEEMEREDIESGGDGEGSTYGTR